MTGILVFLCDDLREQVNDNWGMFFKTADGGGGGDSDETTDAGKTTKEFHKKG
eukprot:CAMPEP_0198276256 /NCGR_PEP_ID=MMETSP1447-20131203/65217_1 /TAXON_ID=420782 /ORGANISM="Chaetoceros dichaeta, Strain CCMP1751" /LENGTH=52 /DNA_ID=CAMNT_0043971195 /DNA_START=1321 /DNA_END=1479 /DNA_ORIENTATION=+